MEAVASVCGKHALVLGAGGGSQGIAYGLVREAAIVTITNRSRDRADELARRARLQAVAWEERARSSTTCWSTARRSACIEAR